MLFRSIKAIYAPILKRTMHHKAAVLLFGAMILAVAFGLIAPNLGSEFIPKLSEGAIALNIIRQPGTSLDESMARNTAMELTVLKQFPDEVEHVWSRVGSAEIATDPMGVELTDMYITLKPKARWTKAKTQDQLTDLIRKELRTMPGQKIAFEQPIEMRMSEMETGIRTDFGVLLFGDDLEILKAKGDEIEKVLKAIPGSADVSVEQITGQPVLQVQVKQDQIARYGHRHFLSRSFARRSCHSNQR